MKHQQSSSADRKSIRLIGYDYRLPGVYFVSIVTWQRACLFGDVVEGKMRLNSVGKIVQSEWENLEHHFPYIRTDASIVMPNHIHGIIIIESEFSVGATQPTKSENKEIKISRVEPIVDGLSGSPQKEGSRQNVGAHTTTIDNEDIKDSMVERMDDTRGRSPEIEASRQNVGATHTITIDNKDIKDSMVERMDDTRGGSPEIGMVVQKARATRHTANVLMDNGTTWVNKIDDDPNGSPLQVSAGPKGPRAGSVGMIVGQFKSRATKRIWSLSGCDRHPIWQRNYYEHIVRNNQEYQNIILYIDTNPLQWIEDEYFLNKQI